MENIEQLMKDREVLLRYGASTEQVDAKIRQLRQSLIEACAKKVVDSFPTGVEASEESRFVVAAEYQGGRLTRTAFSTDVDLEKVFDNVMLMLIDDWRTITVLEEPEESLNEEASEGDRQGSFSVRFADGQVIGYTTAVNTFTEALRYMGLERASGYSDITFKDYPLIGRKKRDNGNWQKQVDGWWIYTNMTNSRKADCLEGVAKMLDIPVEILWHKDNPDLAPKKKPATQSRYTLNDCDPLPKNRLVREAVRQYMERNPQASFRDIDNAFPRDLQGSYGVVRTVADIEMRSHNNRTERQRWFLEQEDLLVTADGTCLAVCKEWGDNFPAFSDHLLATLGWEVEEA